MADGYRALPSVDRILSDQRLGTLRQTLSHEALVDLARRELEGARAAIAAGATTASYDSLVEGVLRRAEEEWRPSLRRVINATGVIIHTNIGRAPLSKEAIAAVEMVSRGYSNLEFDLPSGGRGSRHRHVEELLCRLAGAEAAMAVNNNASAVLIGLSALCQGREVVISRGQAVEIGGGFRIPDVMVQSGARLVEVGTTNRTYARDYERSLTESTAALLRVHASNFRVIGFTHQATLEEMVEVADRHGIFVLDDLGSGCLIDPTRFGLVAEPLVQESVAAGAGVACFSGDKLLGGPQAGLLVGKKALIDRIKSHPLARAVRIDKMTLAALSATLLHYLKGEALAKIPVWQMISTTQEALARRAQRWAEEIGPRARVVDGESAIGGGSLPGETLPTKLVAITPAGEGPSVDELARRLRMEDPAILARIDKNALLLDPRTVLPDEDVELLKAVQHVV
ncbi:MAG: L-seryl-tRNA(Sec) selenium transferase [Chloroflexi bacterium]|nr:L-seryl-tRNA(Sec) selenium transferase [Chloroflexota bacterium]